VLKDLYKRRREEEEGFTLIELMVVVLILGILMAIAIPTFLGARSSANDAAAQSNATNVTTSELAYQVNNGTFVPSGAGASKLDSSIPWVTGGAASGKVDVWVASSWSSTIAGGTNDASTATGNVFLLEALSGSNDCFIVMSDQTGNGVTAYAVTTGGCPSALPSTEPDSTLGPGAAKNKASTLPANSHWYSSW